MGVLAFYRPDRVVNFEVTQGEDRTADDQLFGESYRRANLVDIY